jgi:hypothetical protein
MNLDKRTVRETLSEIAAAAASWLRREVPWRLVTILLTVALVWVGWAQYRSSRVQAKIMRTQAEIMSRQLDESQSEQRAWVSLTKNSAIESLALNASNQLRVTLSLELQNTGKNPAASVFVSAEMSIGTELPHATMELWENALCEQEHPGELPAMGSTIFPGGIEPVFDIEAGLSALEAAEPKRSTMAPIVAVCIAYQDAVTHRAHYTPLAFRVLTNGPTPGTGSVGIDTSTLPLRAGALVLRPWIRGNLPPN